jgi:putative ABC transport system permease protein
MLKEDENLDVDKYFMKEINDTSIFYNTKEYYMGTLIRGIKNIFRNKFRNIAVILILCLCLSLALMMVNMNFSLNNITKSIKRKMGTRFDVTVNYEYIEKLYREHGEKASEEGESLFMVDEALADEILKIDSVESVNKLISGSFTSKKLKSYEAEMMQKEGERYEGAVEEKVIGEEGEEIDPATQFSLLGVTDANMDPRFQEGDINLVEGNFFKSTDIEQNVALIEKNFAERNRLKVGSDMIIKEEKIKVCGIYEFEDLSQFSGFEGSRGEQIYIPFKTAQRLLNRKGKVDLLTVKVDSLDNVQKTINYINNRLSDGKIKAHQEMTKYSQILHSNNSIKRISKISMISAFTAGVLIILSIMFINTRNRATEIGILKAIGASNLNISAQFLVESLAICIIALILSVVVILAANKPVSDFVGGRAVIKVPEMWVLEEMEKEKEKGEGYELETVDMDGLFQLINLKITFSPQILIFAILLTFLLGIVGSLIPAYYISKLRPAEVLRFE